jgi:isocitrate lyase
MEQTKFSGFCRTYAHRKSSHLGRQRRYIRCHLWCVAADANVAGEMYPDQSLYPANSDQSETNQQRTITESRPNG